MVRQSCPNSGLDVVKKSLFVWLMIIPLAVINGAVRESVLESLLGRFALPASGMSLCVMILLLAWVCVPRLEAGEPRQLMLVGLVWAVLAMLFECLLGSFLGRSWAELAAAYDVTSGNLWLLVVLCLVCAPWLAAKVRGIV